MAAVTPTLHTLGKVMAEMGRVSMVVVIWLSAQLSNEPLIRTAAMVKPAATTHTQRHLI